MPLNGGTAANGKNIFQTGNGTTIKVSPQINSRNVCICQEFITKMFVRAAMFLGGMERNLHWVCPSLHILLFVMKAYDQHTIQMSASSLADNVIQVIFYYKRIAVEILNIGQSFYYHNLITGIFVVTFIPNKENVLLLFQCYFRKWKCNNEIL